MWYSGSAILDFILFRDNFNYTFVLRWVSPHLVMVQTYFKLQPKFRHSIDCRPGLDLVVFGGTWCEKYKGTSTFDPSFNTTGATCLEQWVPMLGAHLQTFSLFHGQDHLAGELAYCACFSFTM